MSTRDPPLFVVSTPENGPTRHLDARTSGHLVQPEGSPAPRMAGASGGSTRVPGAKKKFFLKFFVDRLGCSNHSFLARFEPVLARLGHGKSQNALKMGRLEPKMGRKWVEKSFFQKVIHDNLGCSNKCS